MSLESRLCRLETLLQIQAAESEQPTVVVTIPDNGRDPQLSWAGLTFRSGHATVRIVTAESK